MSKYLKYIPFALPMIYGVFCVGGLYEYNAARKLARQEQLGSLKIRCFNRRNWDKKDREDWLKAEMTIIGPEIGLSHKEIEHWAKEARKLDP